MKSRGLHRTVLASSNFAILIVTGIAALLFLAPFLIWRLGPAKPMNIWVIDKTVPYTDYKEHAGLHWILKNEKITKAGSKLLYDEKSDYFGFYPSGKASWRESPLPTSGPKPDLIYLADTYGVYADDYMQRRLSSGFSPKIYGGLSTADTVALRQALGGGNTIIAEFNVAASPTNAADRKSLGKLLGVSWVGWIGKYFENLTRGDAVPSWVISNYETQKGVEWKFSGRGFILIGDDDRIEVLLEGRDVSSQGLKIAYRDKYAKKFGIHKAVSFRQWFEWVRPETNIETAADFRFDLTESGAALLADLGLPATFPAVMNYKTPQYSAWYFSGDFVELALPDTPYSFAGLAGVKRLLVDDSVDSNAYFYWKAFVPMMTSILGDVRKTRSEHKSSDSPSAPELRVRAFGKGFMVRDDDGIWKDFFVRGVNLGMAEPGKFFTEFPEDIATYRRWLDMIGDMNANTIRIYTLPPPEFYQALEAHNRINPGKALYLLQGIWPEENPPNGDYLAGDYNTAFAREIDYGVDAVYGRANIMERKGRSWGIYTVDVSRWLLGWTVGRELESEEVLSTDARNKGATFAGKYVSAGPAASPTETWLAESLDTVASIEAERYGKLHPASIVSWPTLDPVSHESEWKPESGKTAMANDRAFVDISHLDISAAMGAGIFGSYHIYPNYPDFMNNELSYGEYRDEDGVLRYGGYLREFMKGHAKYPALVAEFGLANGAAVAHFAPDGLNHGGIDETAQGDGILRMMRAIKREGYAGGVIFEWMDEWVKKTWTTESLMIPYDRHILWHNICDPGQNYGLLADEAISPESPRMTTTGTGLVSGMGLSADAEWFHATITLSRPIDFAHESLLVGLDTYDRALGQMRFSVEGPDSASGLEFLLRIDGPEKAKLLVIPAYNVANHRYATVRASDGVFETMLFLTNSRVVTEEGRRIEEKRFDASLMRMGAFDESGNLWRMEGNRIEIRIPWTRLNVTDPSSLRVLQDKRTDFFDPGRDDLQTVPTDGFVVSTLIWDRAGNMVSGRLDGDPAKPFLWEGWETTPPYRERLKKSYDIIKSAWGSEAGIAVR
ncbi:MAG: hypothetical protein WAX33_05070 [Rectinemataceae bacterium]